MIRTPYFAVRSTKNIVAHNDYLSSLKPQSTKDHILNKVFRHQPAAYGAQNILDELKDRNPHELDEIELASYFYTECFIKNNLRRGLDVNNGSELTPEEFIEQIAGPRITRHRNNLYFLVGTVGVGKTSFLNYLISVHGQEWVENQNRWLLRIDVETGGQGGKISEEFLFHLIAEKTVRILERREELVRNSQKARVAQRELEAARLPYMLADFTRYLEENPKEGAAKCAQQRKAFSDLVEALYMDCRKLPVIIIDNIDYLYHRNDRSLFYNHFSTQEETSPETTGIENQDNISADTPDELVEGLCQLVGRFYKEGPDPLGGLGANILFVMREDTYQVVANSGKTSLPPNWAVNNNRLYKFCPPAWKDVLECRGKLHNFAVLVEQKGVCAALEDMEANKLPNNEILTAIHKELNSAPNGDPILLELLEEITNHGLRQSMDYFAQYSWICQIDDVHCLGSAEGNKLIHQYPVGLITFMLGKKRLFSQFSAEFPNIYLVNSQRFEHAHSYWLKRLIVDFVYWMNEQEIEVVATDIINVFRGPEGKGYEDKVIRECLGSLVDVNQSNVLSVSWHKITSADRMQMKSITLTPRGERCVSYIFDRFLYLQLIIDDYLLPLPREFGKPGKPGAWDIFRFGHYLQHYGRPLDYSYIVWERDAYLAGAQKMIDFKAKLVLWFLMILETSLELEKKHYPSVFEQLIERNIPIPNVEHIRQGVIHELNSLNDQHGGFLKAGGRDMVKEYEKSANDHREAMKSYLTKAYQRDVDYIPPPCS